MLLAELPVFGTCDKFHIGLSLGNDMSQSSQSSHWQVKKIAPLVFQEISKGKDIHDGMADIAYSHP